MPWFAVISSAIHTTHGMVEDPSVHSSPGFWQRRRQYCDLPFDVLVLSTKIRYMIGGDVVRTVVHDALGWTMFDGANHPTTLQYGFREIGLKRIFRPFIHEHQLRVVGYHGRGELLLVGNRRNVPRGDDPVEDRGPGRLARVFWASNNELSNFLLHLGCEQTLIQFVQKVDPHFSFREGV